MDLVSNLKRGVLQWLIAIAIFLSPIHLCKTGFYLPDGESCQACPTLKDSVADHQNEVVFTSAEHKDCHDCCTLKSCNEAGKTKNVQATLSPVQMVAAIPTVIVIQSFEALKLPPVKPVFIEGCPTKGPPQACSSRAPPAFRTV
jgi:hypothetical protein